LEEAEKKLRDTADEFDASRQEAKHAKDAFQEIKEERYCCVIVVLNASIKRTLILLITSTKSTNSSLNLALSH
jgi:DNA-directed RNA polymerase subunit N (RpoN/RPB10)